LETNIIIRVASSSDVPYATAITQEMESSAKARGTGIAKRSPEYVAKKMEEGKAVIGVMPDGSWVGYCYIDFNYIHYIFSRWLSRLCLRRRFYYLGNNRLPY